MLEVRNVTKYYGDSIGVDGVDFRVGAGEILGLLGPNGAGKTTTMRIITGFLPPTQGTVEVAGHDILEDSLEARRAIGYLPENPPIYPEMSVRGYVEFVADIREVPRARRQARVDNVLERLDLGPVQNRLVGNLSRGYRQRVGLAQALVHDPAVLILDEPTVGLDPKQIIEIRSLIRDLGRDRTVVLSSHILPEVSQVCHTVAIINRGRVVAIDSPEHLAGRLKGAETLKIGVKGEPGAVIAVLEKIPGVAKVTRIDGGSEPASGPVPQAGAYLLESYLGCDVREDLFFNLARAEMPLLELRPMDLSLEQVFLQLTTEEEGVELDG
ncbi:MAG: ATP-binding cassette domain-containing protein [Firmicutes bacterium]|nr:ATP-binding cassette domain-containing protein [Bacillota bacterium]